MPFHRLYYRRICEQTVNHGVHVYTWRRRVECDGLTDNGKEGHEPHDYWQEKTCVCEGRYE